MFRPTVSPATDDDIARFYGGIQFNAPWVAKAMHKGRLVAGIGGLIEIEPGTWIGFLEVPAHERTPSLYRHVIEVLDQAKQAGAVCIKTWCDDRIPRAEAMMRKLGFVPTDETIDNKVVWAWAHSPD